MKTVISRIDLGFTRIAGYTLYDEASHEFQETTPKEVKNLIVHGQVNGLKLVNGEIELDKENFYMTNLMIKSAVGKFRTLYQTESIMNCINYMYAVVRVIETDKGRIYEIISNRCARVKVNEEKLKILLQVGYVAGVRKQFNGEIEICKGVNIENRRTKESEIKEKVQATDAEAEQGLSDINSKENISKSENAESLETIFKSMDTSDIKDKSLANEQTNKKTNGTRKTKQK